MLQAGGLAGRVFVNSSLCFCFFSFRPSFHFSSLCGHLAVQVCPQTTPPLLTVH